MYSEKRYNIKTIIYIVKIIVEYVAMSMLSASLL